jgi:hypothetical protein
VRLGGRDAAYPDSIKGSELSRRQMTLTSAVGDAITNHSTHVVEDELPLRRPSNPASYELRFPLCPENQAIAVHVDVPATVGRLHAHNIGHVLLLLPATGHSRNAMAGGPSWRTSSLPCITRPRGYGAVCWAWVVPSLTGRALGSEALGAARAQRQERDAVAASSHLRARPTRR